MGNPAGRNPGAETTVGIDIGTTSVKAVAADGDGRILRRCQIRHPVHAPSADVFEHDPQVAWIDGVLEAWHTVADGLDIAAVTVGAMVPSLCGVDADGAPVTRGLLYGDARGRGHGDGTSVSGEVIGFAAALADADGVAGLWPAQAVANRALCGVGAIDTTTAMTAMPLFTGVEWDPSLCAEIGVDPGVFPATSPGAAAVGTVDGALVAGGTVDALAEQMVADAGDPGDALVICGTTLITWAVTDEWREVDGLWTVPYSTPGMTGIGGASNAGGLFIDRVRSMVGDLDPARLDDVDSDDLPTWLPYIRGERTPLHDDTLRAQLIDLSVGHGPEHVLAAAYEAAGFVVRHHLDLAATGPKRIVAAGGGTRSPHWMQALADTTGLPVDVSAVPEGAALGAAYNSRITAGFVDDASGARGWVPIARRVEPRDVWADAADDRYRRFREATRS